jgi:hypothetical protein
MPNNIIKLADRIKEVSYTMGTGSLVLSGPVSGFSSFGSAYATNSTIFYAITDGSSYEIGSGVYTSGAQNELSRFPFKSSNSNSRVNFPEGIKEVYVTYPATHSVYIGSGVSNYNIPQTSGLAVWASPNVLDYDSKLIWDKHNSRLGVNHSSPQYAIDIGGNDATSIMKVNGIIVGSSGIIYDGGASQVDAYQKNQLDQYAYDNELIDNLTGSHAVLELSGVSNQYILFKPQVAGTVFAGPISGCSPPCSPGYPSFRMLTETDIPAIATVSGILNDKIFAVNTKTNSVSGVLRNDLVVVSGLTVGNSPALSGILRNDIAIVSGISSVAAGSSGILRNDITTVSGLLVTPQNIATISGILRNDIVAVSGLVVSSNLLILERPVIQGRLTLESAVPVSMTDQSNKQTLYYTPYLGDRITLWNGSSWSTASFTEKSISLAGLSINTAYDIFGYFSSNTLALEIGTAWSGLSTRSVALTRGSNGIYTKSGDLSRRYLGTIVTNGTAGGFTDDNLSTRYVWNVNNRVNRKVYRESDSGPWTYGTNSWRILGGSSPARYIYVINGLDDSIVDLTASILFTTAASPASNNYYYLGVAKDSNTTSPSMSTRVIYYSSTEHNQLSTRLVDNVGLGWHHYFPVEQSSYNATLYGGNGGSYFGGIYGTWEC